MFEDTVLTTREIGGDALTCEPPVPVHVARLREIAASLGATGFSVLFSGPASAGSRLVPVVDSSFPALSDASRQLSARAADRLAMQLACETRPIVWLSPAGGGTLVGLRWAVMSAPPCESCQAGIALPVDDGAGRKGAIAFFGQNFRADDRSLAQAHWDCFDIFASLAHERAPVDDKAPSVSRREIECLKLTATGLTSEDIADELGLSVHTANQYLSNGAQKLNAVNRVHAVAKALRTGLID